MKVSLVSRVTRWLNRNALWFMVIYCCAMAGLALGLLLEKFLH